MRLRRAIIDYNMHLFSKDLSPHTIKGYEHELKAFQRFLEQGRNRPIDVADIEFEDLEKYLVYRKEKGNKPVSRNRTISILRSFYRYLIKREAIVKDISIKLESVRTGVQERAYLKPNEMDQLMENTEHPLFKPIIMTFLYTGMRMDELRKLELEDVDLDNLMIRIKHGKGNKERVVPIHYKLEPVLRHYRDYIRPKTVLVFFATHKTGGISRQYINVYLSELALSLGYEKHVTAHILRHSFASALVKSNAPLPAIQKLLGHSDLRVTSRYIHQDTDQLQDAVNLL